MLQYEHCSPPVVVILHVSLACVAKGQWIWKLLLELSVLVIDVVLPEVVRKFETGLNLILSNSFTFEQFLTR